MMITKLHLPRRTFLRGMGATLALPLLDAMVPALSATAATAANPVRRLGFIYIPHGAVMQKWTPGEEGRITELSPTLRALEGFQDQMIVPTNLEHRNAQGNGTDGNAEHTRSNAAWLSAARPKMTEGADVRLATTVDQIAAQELCKDTRLPSLELTVEPNFLVGNCDNGYNCVYVNSMSWRTPTVPLPMEGNPRLVFERLFGDGGSPGERLTQMHADTSILDSVVQDMKRLQRSLGATDRVKVVEYTDAIREVERRIQKTEQQATTELMLPTRPIGIPENFEDHVKLLFDLQVLAYQADITRVFTFMMGREQSQRTFPQIGINEGHHGVSHHQGNAQKIAMIEKINVYHLTLFRYFLEKMRATPDGDGNLLDHSMLLYGSGMSDGNMHNHVNLPLVVVGGGAGRLKGGHHIKYPEPVPMANLLVGLLDKAGVHLDKFGDSTDRINLEPLSLTTGV
jgi:Protein of unknown function (DUF1552)